MHQVFRTLLVTCFIISITIIIILYGSGYRFNIDKKTLDTTGTLVAKSDPDGAKVLINGKISGATNTNIPLAPGSYEVSLVKEGYITWEKKLPIQGEVVTQTNATLFPKNPSLTALTSSGIINPLVAPDGSKIIYARSEEATTAATFDGKLVTPSGLWVYDLVERPLSLNRDPQQIAANTSLIDYSKAHLIWAPDGKQVIALFTTEKPAPTIIQKTKTLNSNTKNTLSTLNLNTVSQAVILDTNRLNAAPQDITATIAKILDAWDTVRMTKQKEKLAGMPTDFATTSAAMNIIAYSPDEVKVLYEATASATIPIIIKPPLMGTNPTKEERTIEAGKIYVYDAKEDKNYPIVDASTVRKESITTMHTGLAKFLPQTYHLAWYSSSRHLIIPQDGKITIMEYDGTNKAVIYSGPFEYDFTAPWPSGGKIAILTTLNTSISTLPNLYLINLK